MKQTCLQFLLNDKQKKLMVMFLNAPVHINSLTFGQILLYIMALQGSCFS